MVQRKLNGRGDAGDTYNSPPDTSLPPHSPLSPSTMPDAESGLIVPYPNDLAHNGSSSALAAAEEDQADTSETSASAPKINQFQEELPTHRNGEKNTLGYRIARRIHGRFPRVYRVGTRVTNYVRGPRPRNNGQSRSLNRFM
jgi:hypothetical protein